MGPPKATDTAEQRKADDEADADRSDRENRKKLADSARNHQETAMKNTMKSLIALATFAIAAPMFAAAQATSSITVTASVSAVCSISTITNLDFGAYDPVVANAATPKNETAPAVVSVSCTKSTPNVYVDFASSAGTMTSGTNTLTFNLYTTGGHGTLFGSGNTFAPLSFAAGKAAQLVSIYGQIPQNQDVPAGSYSGTVTARVNY
jgi:spore coat protein U-like protein